MQRIVINKHVTVEFEGYKVVGEISGATSVGHVYSKEPPNENEPPNESYLSKCLFRHKENINDATFHRKDSKGEYFLLVFYRDNESNDTTETIGALIPTSDKPFMRFVKTGQEEADETASEDDSDDEDYEEFQEDVPTVPFLFLEPDSHRHHNSTLYFDKHEAPFAYAYIRGYNNKGLSLYTTHAPGWAELSPAERDANRNVRKLRATHPPKAMVNISCDGEVKIFGEKRIDIQGDLYINGEKYSKGSAPVVGNVQELERAVKDLQDKVKDLSSRLVFTTTTSSSIPEYNTISYIAGENTTTLSFYE